MSSCKENSDEDNTKEEQNIIETRVGRCQCCESISSEIDRTLSIRHMWSGEWSGVQTDGQTKLVEMAEEHTNILRTKKDEVGGVHPVPRLTDWCKSFQKGIKDNRNCRRNLQESMQIRRTPKEHPVVFMTRLKHAADEAIDWSLEPQEERQQKDKLQDSALQRFLFNLQVPVLQRLCF